MRRANVAFFVPHLGCTHNCSFCNQRSISGEEAPPSPDEIARVARQALERLGGDAAASEIAFFGGSFTAIETGLMVSLLGAATPFTGPGGFRGIRVSTRPDAIDDEKLRILKAYHVTSVELGAQSMDDRVLRLNGRGHTADQVRTASRMIAESGFELGLQMMTGLYGDSDGGARETAAAIASLHPATVRIYPTIVLPGTRLAALYESGVYRPETLGGAVVLCSELLEYFTSRAIRIIRLGLHASPGIERERLAGPWHPAFRELCESKIYLSHAREALLCAPCVSNGESPVLLVARGGVSAMTGQRRCNLRALSREFGVLPRVREAAGLREFEVAVRYEASADAKLPVKPSEDVKPAIHKG